MTSTLKTADGIAFERGMKLYVVSLRDGVEEVQTYRDDHIQCGRVFPTNRTGGFRVAGAFADLKCAKAQLIDLIDGERLVLEQQANELRVECGFPLVHSIKITQERSEVLLPMFAELAALWPQPNPDEAEWT